MIHEVKDYPILKASSQEPLTSSKTPMEAIIIIIIIYIIITQNSTIKYFSCHKKVTVKLQHWIFGFRCIWANI